MLQLNTEGLTANNISFIEQLASKNKAFIIVLQETHCTTADKLVSDSQLFSSWVSPEQEPQSCHICPWAVGMVTGRSVSEQSETEWLCVDVAGYIINIYKPPRSRFTPTAIPTFPHPSMYVGDFNCQHVNWGYNKTSDGESLESWATSSNLGLYNPKATASFFSHRWNVGTNPDLAFASFGQDNRLPDRRVCSRKVPAVTTSAFPSNATEAQGSCPQRSGEALELSQGWLEALLPSHRWIRWEIVTSGHIKHWEGIPEFLRVPAIRGQTMQPTWLSEELYAIAGTKSARPSIVPSPEPHWILTLIELLRPYYLGQSRSRSDGRKLSTPSTSRTLAARSGEPPTNLLAGLDAPLASAPSRPTPSPHNSWRTGTQDRGP